MKILKKVHDSQVFIAHQNDDMLQEFKKLRQENELLKKNQEISNNTIKNLTSRLEDLEYKMAEMDQKELDFNININGLPNMAYEESFSTLLKIGKELEINVSDDDIVGIRKLENKKTKRCDYSFQLRNNNIRSLFLTRRMDKRIFITPSKEIVCGVDNLPNASRIYINEHLSKFNFNLLNQAKSLKQHGYNYIWYKFGKIFVRKTGNSNIILIRSMKMVNDLINSLPSVDNN